MTPKFFIQSVRQALVALVSIGLVLGPLADARAQTPLADIPIASKVTAKPNIVYTLDDSGSMQFNYLPDWVIAGAAVANVTSITRAGAVATVTVGSTAALSVGQWVIILGANQPEYNGEFKVQSILSGTKFTISVVGAPATPATGTIKYSIGSAYCRSGTTVAPCSVGALSTFNSPPFYAASFNHLAYDTSVNYQPPVKYDRTPLTHTIGSDTDGLGNQAFFNNVQTDPFTAPNTHANLTVKVAVPLYCNTDWPITSGGAASSLTIADVGDPNGEYQAGTGAWCRINGTKYDASIASGAPAVLEDYNYPYQSSSGATGTQYFYRQLTNKILYCDRSSPYWPKTTGAIIGCTLGGTPTCGGLPCAPQKQTCNLSTPGKTCNPTVALRNFTPAACKTPNALYCLPSVGGSDSFSPGTGTAPECLSCTCNADYQPPNTKKCSITGAGCTTVCGVPGCNVAECPDQPAPAPNGCSAGVPIYSYVPVSSPACTATLWDPVANAPLVPATTLLQDSNAQGYVCRHNNQVYAVSGAPAAGGPFTYPRINIGDVYAANKTGIAPYTQLGHFGTGAQGYSTGTSCPTIGTTINIPRHYYTIDSVQFCDNIDATVNGQWRGFGAGVCKPANDLTQFQNVKYGQFHRIALVNDGRTYPYTDQLTGIPATRNYTQEITNYANWFAYYRLRSLAAKTTSSLAFDQLDDTYRVGFHTLGSEPTPIGTGIPITWVDVDDFKPGAGNHRNLWWNALFAVPTVTNYKTPTLSAMLRIGNLFQTGTAGGLPATVASLPAGAKDPLKDSSGNVVSCQSNYHILFTDGFTNQIALPGVAGEKDNVTPAAWPPPGLLADGVTPNPDNVLPDLPVASPWPAPFKWGTTPVPDTAADIGMYYWARDLRAGVKDDVPSWSGKTPNDIDPTKDVAWWQHVQFSALSFGSAGTLDVENQPATLANIVGGTVQWPDITSPNNPPLPASNKGAVSIDDLWHATVNARGAYVFATSPLEVQYGLGAILAGISNQRKSRAGAAFAGQVLSTTNDIIYEATIEQGWAGDLLKVQIDSDPTSPTAGQEIATLWRASPVLWDRVLNTGQIAPAFVGDEPWMDETKRRIVTFDGIAKVAFRATAAGPAGKLSGAQLGTLSPSGFMQRRMVAYLRGGTTYKTTAADPGTPGTVMTIEGTSIGQFRKRSGPLGDISNAQPLVVSAPVDPPIFNTGADPGYAGYVAAQKAAGYKDRVVAAANDGMVHVFDSVDGHEIFAYVPSSLLRTTVDANGRPTGIQALTFQDGGVPLYKHHFYVDSSPRTADVDLNSAGVKGGGSDWHTIVVGGMGKGGSAYYALDLTDGNATDESQAAAKLLWEFSDADWRYTYGRPIIVKTYQYGWTVIVTSGYNNVSGEGRIYLLDPKTGKPHNAAQPYISTGAVSCLGPDGVTTQTSGLAQINGFTKDFHNQFVEQVYGGDLCGNLWRFDLTATSGNYPAPQLFAVLTDPVGKPQPITTAPQIEIDLANGVDRYVFIGTGRLLDVADFTTPTIPQAQTMYAIRDDKLDTPIPDGDPALPIAPRSTLAAVPAGGAPVAGGAPNGWFHDLPDGSGGPGAPNERIVIDVEGDVNTVTYIGTQTTNDVCTIALPANIYAREFATGTSLINDPLNGWFYHDDAGGVGMQIIGMQDPTTGAITLAGLLSHEIPGTKPIAFKNPSTFGRNRMSWRLLTGE